MEELLNLLKENPVQYFATVGQDNKPKVRPFQFMIEQDGKLWFCTNNTKVVYNEMKNNPNVEVCVCTQKFEWLRLSGKATFVDDLSIKEKIIEYSPLVKNLYKEATNPIFKVFYLADAKAIFADFSGNPPREITL